MKKIAVIALRHREQPNLFLHGLRRDNQKWACAGGHCHPGETDHESATRELEEETGLKDVKIEKVHERMYGQNHIILFHGVHPEGQMPDAKQDPDKEFVTFKFLDPTTHGNLHVPHEHNIVSDWMKGRPQAPVQKAAGKMKVEPFVVDSSAFNPKKHDFIIRYQVRGKQVGFLAVTHKKDGIMPFNFEVKTPRKGIGTEMAKHAERLSGKKIIRSPDMTESGRSWANKYIGPQKMKKAEIIHNEDTSALMNRDETKHFMPKENLDKLINGIKSELPDGDPDTSVRFNVNQTIYLDNPDLDALRDNMERHKPRFKVRIRRYSPNGNQWEDVAYVELKLKTKEGETKKVRVRIKEEDIESVCEGKPIRIDEAMEKLNHDIPKDIFWKRVTSINTILEKYGFKKQIVVTYQRRAYTGDGLRVTIDDSIRYHDAHEISPDAKSMIAESSYFKAFKKRHMKVRKQDYVIVETKEETGIPKWLQKILDECDAKVVHFSKYCGAMVSFMVSGGEQGIITRNRKIDSNSVLAAIEGYEVFNKAEQPPAQPPMPMVLQIPVSLGGKTSKMTIKNFGDMNTIDHASIRNVIDGQKFHEPIDSSKMIFKPHVLKGVDGKELHILLVYGAPNKIMNMKGSTPYIPIDKEDYEKFSKLGPALTSKQSGVKFHPAELKAGDQVIKTY